MLIEVKCGMSTLDIIEVPDDSTEADIWNAIMEELENSWIEWGEVDEDGNYIGD